MVDYSGGFVAAISLLAGVHAARRDGTGLDCDVSLFDTAIGLLTYPAAWHLNAGFNPVRTHHSAHPSLVPFQAFAAADGWLVVGCAKEKFWQRLVAVLERPDLGDDERFATFADRQRHAAQLLPVLESIFAARPVADWLGLLEPAGVPCGPVNDVASALTDPHTLARGMVVTTDHPTFGQVRQVASPVRVGEPPVAYRRAPRRNEDCDYVVRDLLGYDDARIAALTAAGAFGVPA
jgi:crotonobetainyl-CoA:carnitine CoA-transferase CaiB-like acyl-CoA transferase